MMRRKHRFLSWVILFAFMTASFPFPACAQEAASETIRVAVALSEDLSPTEFYDEKTSKFEGFSVMYFDLLSWIIGLEFTFVPRPDVESLKQLASSGEI